MSETNTTPTFLLQEQLAALAESGDVSEGALVALSATVKLNHTYVKSLIAINAANKEKYDLMANLVELSEKREKLDAEKYLSLADTLNAVSGILRDQKKIMAVQKEKLARAEELQKDAARVLGLGDAPPKRQRRK